MKEQEVVSTKLKVGDKVMVIAGGSGDKRKNKGALGKIIRFTDRSRTKVIVDGVNFVTKHKRQTTVNDVAAKITMEAPIHVSNVMYYADEEKKPVKLSYGQDKDGKKVRGYYGADKEKFIAI